jgi:hypothetical protein
MHGARLEQPIPVTATAEGGAPCRCDVACPHTASRPLELLLALMKQVTLPFPFVWLTIRVEPAAAARRRALLIAPPRPASTSMTALKQTLNKRLLRDIGLDDSGRD